MERGKPITQLWPIRRRLALLVPPGDLKTDLVTSFAAFLDQVDVMKQQRIDRLEQLMADRDTAIKRMLRR